MKRLPIQMLSWLMLMVCSVDAAYALDWQGLWQRPDQTAYKKLQAGDSTAAAELFNDQQWRAVSHYRAGEFEEAQKEFSIAEKTETALYNQAVTSVQQGDYDTAIEKFETLLEQTPDHQDAQHNLEIARELSSLQEQNPQDQQNNNQDQQSEEQRSEDQQEQEQSEEDSASSDSQSASEDSTESDSDEKQNGGELSSNPEDAEKKQSESDSQQSEQQEGELGEQQLTEQEEASDDESQTAENTIPASAAPTESEQATEQWLRRIPDDPSQLLRNKIKLNHMIEHADVRDMREPW